MTRSLFLPAFVSTLLLSTVSGQDVFPIKPSEAEIDSIQGDAPTEAVVPAEAVEETKVDVQFQDFSIRPGDNLSKVSEEVYGSAGYWRLIKLYNPEIDPDKLQEGQVVKVPKLESVLESEKLIVTLGETISGLMKARDVLLKHEESLEQLAANHTGSGNLEIPEEARTELQEGKKMVDAAMDRLSKEGEGIVAVPQSTVAQLRSASELIGDVAKGNPAQFAGKFDRIHQHLGLALTYSVIWARAGFK